MTKVAMVPLASITRVMNASRISARVGRVRTVSVRDSNVSGKVRRITRAKGTSDTPNSIAMRQPHWVRSAGVKRFDSTTPTKPASSMADC